MRIREEYRYFFFITNDRAMPADQVVLTAGGRCDQENLIAQLKGGVHALTTPVDNLVSNWAYMVMASLAWSLKAWAALLVPETPRHAEEHRAQKRTLLRMEFATFRAAMIAIPCQIVRGGRRLVYRLLSWNPWQGAFLRLVERLNGCLAVLSRGNSKPGSGSKTNGPGEVPCGMSTLMITAASPGHFLRRVAAKIVPPCVQIQRRPVRRVSPWPIVFVAIRPKRLPDAAG